ncbi:unnamed protein product [Bursaphelenchus xylophilus]|uniref:(pine wood nematode) hypothetical protein n=1 Tax=Bursaphelenchus xylophilus TaxID=6326 RepID=A0A1I7SQR4_BURXY|nr:unnamed protein product [Bursaphelenchus xylophilus]CAG9110276.1 unnamed protein product [Bursaphelenchus xylophilus]
MRKARPENGRNWVWERWPHFPGPPALRSSLMYPLLVAFVVPALLVALLGLLTCLHRNQGHVSSSQSGRSWFWPGGNSHYLLIPSSQPVYETSLQMDGDNLPRYQDLRLPVNKLKTDPLTKTWSV